MTKFHEGQEVEVQTPKTHGPAWRKAKIISMSDINHEIVVELQDGTLAVFGAGRIRVRPLTEILSDFYQEHPHNAPRGEDE